MNGLCKINNLDAYTTYGVIFPETSVSKLTAFAPLKSYIKNKGASFDGVHVIPTSDFTPKVDERDITLVFYLRAKNLTQYNERLDSFESVLRAGMFTLWFAERPNSLYRLLYQSCNEFKSFNGRLAKFTLKVTEPNPTNRSLETIE